MKENREYFMEQALLEANKAYVKNEVPIGCVIVKNNEVIATGHNNRECAKNALAHAEIIAINEACNNELAWRLGGCTLYVTLEPCPMCMGAIINSRIDCVVFGANDKKAGCCGSTVDFSEIEFNHKPLIIRGVKEAECAKILSDFFVQLRNKKLFDSSENE